MRDQRWWTWHIAAAAIILVFLGLHMVIMHLDVIVGAFNAPNTDPIAWANVVARAKSAFFMVTYIVLLGAALFHGLYGLRNIVFEMNPAPVLKRGVTVILVLGGVGLFALGTWTAWQSFVLANAGTVARTL